MPKTRVFQIPIALNLFSFTPLLSLFLFPSMSFMIIGCYWLNVVLAFDVTRKPFPGKPAENENRIAVFNFRFPWETEVDFNFVGLGSSCFANRLRWRKKNISVV